MSEEVVSQVSTEVARIHDLELAAQPDEFARLRDHLEQALESAEQSEIN